MTIVLFIIGIVFCVYGIFYVLKHKKKLSEEKIAEYEKTIKPKIIRLLLLSFIPLVALSIYILCGQPNYTMRLFANSGLAIIILSFVGYLRGKRAINFSEHAEHYTYSLNYFIYVGVGQLFLFLAVANSVNDFITN